MRAALVELLEAEGVVFVVGDLVAGDVVGQLTDEVHEGLGLSHQECSMARAAAGVNLEGLDGRPLEAGLVDAEDADQVGPQVRHQKILPSGVEDRLICLDVSPVQGGFRETASHAGEGLPAETGLARGGEWRRSRLGPGPARLDWR